MQVADANCAVTQTHKDKYPYLQFSINHNIHHSMQ